MAVSKEEERYKQFESLREKFSTPAAAAQEPAAQHRERARPSSAGKRRDPRSMAPPLMPLVEEGDQIQLDLYAAPVDERLTKLAVSWS